jgi:peroxiredoxin
VTSSPAVGDPAPPFTAQGSDGRTYVLTELLADGPVLLAFYPGNDTPG